MTKPPSCCASSRCAPPDMLRTTARTLNADRVPAPRAARPALRLVGDVDPRSAVSGSGTPARSDPRRAGGSRSAARRAAEPRAAHGTRAHESGRVVGATPQARADRATDGAEAGRRPHPLHAGPGERALHLPDDRHAREFFQRDCLSASDGVLKENCTSGSSRDIHRGPNCRLTVHLRPGWIESVAEPTTDLDNMPNIFIFYELIGTTALALSC